jgi:hypothetical protein
MQAFLCFSSSSFFRLLADFRTFKPLIFPSSFNTFSFFLSFFVFHYHLIFVSLLFLRCQACNLIRPFGLPFFFFEKWLIKIFLFFLFFIVYLISTFQNLHSIVYLNLFSILLNNCFNFFFYSNE